jgi:hypothetical protein
MQSLRWFLFLGLVTVGWFGSPAATAGDDHPAPVALKAIKYTELGAAIKQLRGKVIVVDFWAET